MSQDKSIKKTKLTATQAKVVKAKIRADLTGGSISAEAPKVYPNATPESARTMMHRELQNVTVQEAITEAMVAAGLTPDTLVSVVKDGMEANKVVQIEGDFYETEVADHSIRLKAAGMAANWLGVGKTPAEGGNTFNFINVSKGESGEFGAA